MKSLSQFTEVNGLPLINLRKCTIKALALLFLLLPCTIGCDDKPKRVKVSGQVVVDGKPVPYGSITFVPTGGRPSSGKLDENGNFTLGCFQENDGALLGIHRIKVSARDLRGKGVKWYAPNKYADVNTSGLTKEITEPIDDLVIELTWDGEKKPGSKRR